MSLRSGSATISASADVGGTFTDVVTVNRITGEVRVAKAPTVAEDPSQGIAHALETAGADLAQMERLVHGTTTGINTLLQRKGARVGFLTTQGYKHLLLIGRGNWPSFRLTWERPEPLVSGRFAAEVRERIKADGTVLVPLDIDDVIAQVGRLIEAGAEAIAVCFINAYVNPQHEQEVGRILAAHYPDVVVCLSHELSRRYREYERAVTTVGEAYLRPRMRHYFDSLTRGMKESGFAGRLFITASDGGVMGVDRARDSALRTLVSGCASGIAGASIVAQAEGWDNLLAIDMGGTSFDAALIRNGHPVIAAEASVAGFEFQVPTISLSTIGAGGGSLAYLDSVGGLHVGPESAGAVPGPVCYGRGGEQPTFTDAALVAGLVPETILDGKMQLSRADAEAAIRKRIAEPLGLSVQQAASGILRIVESKMAMLLEEMTVGNGLDPRVFTLFAYGGGGPLVASRMAEELGIRRILVPQHSGVFSAWGMQSLDVVKEQSLTRVQSLDGKSREDLAEPFESLVHASARELEAEGFSASEVVLLKFVEMRYESQEHTMLISFDERGAEALHAAFDDAHRARFGFTVQGEVEIVTYRVRAVGQLEKHDMAPTIHAPSHMPEERRRTVHHRTNAEAQSWLILRREDLGSVPRTGPALVEEETSTTVVPEGWTFRNDNGNLVIER
nr:hydantoinase/oxoprolinase family protein [Microbacterium sp. 13-71-7]